MPELRTFTWQTDTSEADLPEDRFSDYVNNARYFHFINQCFQGWYRAMGIRGGVPGYSAAMARTEYDFVRQVRPPSRIRVRIEVVRVGRTSIEHAVEIADLGVDGRASAVVAGRGRVVHVWVERARARAEPWPPEVLAKCWDAG